MAGQDRAPWASEAADHVLRPYALVRGRTRPRHHLRLVSRLVARPGARRPETPEKALAVQLCAGDGRAVAEIAATLGMPVQVTKVVLSDLIDTGALKIAHPRTSDPGRDPNTLEAILAGLRHRFPDAG